MAPVNRAEYAAYGDPGLLKAEAREHKPSREEILRYVHQGGSDNLTVFGGMYQGGYYVQQSPEELSDLLYELLTRGGRFVNYLGSAPPLEVLVDYWTTCWDSMPSTWWTTTSTRDHRFGGKTCRVPSSTLAILIVTHAGASLRHGM